MENEGYTPSIKEFYNGKSIFITGGTGFMGKVLIEKLLRSCSGIERIYLLLRPKRGKPLSERLNDIVDNALFEKLMTEQPTDFKRKVIAIAGDISKVNLGLSDVDRKILTENVSIIFHVAASVRFADPLKNNVFMNTRSTRDVLTLAEEMKNLKAHVHVSTAYSNTDRNPLEETVYPPFADWRKTIEIAEAVDQYTLKLLTPKYLENVPNTYVFSKQLAENVIHEKRGKLPVVIFRPPIVISSVSDPIPGWNDNFNGPVGLSVAGGKGILRTSYGRPDIRPNYGPVDITIKAIIVSAWHRGIRKHTPKDEVLVINQFDTKSKVTNKEFQDIATRFLGENPFNNILWLPETDITTNAAKHYVMVLILHVLPAILIDSVLKLTGKKPMLLKIQRKIYVVNEMLSYYLFREWEFSNDKYLKISQQIPLHESDEFYYGIEDVNEIEYIHNAIQGCKYYLLKEKKGSEIQAKKHLQRMTYISWTTYILFWGFMLWCLTIFIRN